jgi:hypothetical protein
MEKGNFKNKNLKVNVKGQFTHYEWPLFPSPFTLLID